MRQGTHPTHCDCIDALYARELSHRTANMLQSAIAAVHLVRRQGADLAAEALDRLSALAETSGMLARRPPAAIDLTDVLDALGAAVVRSHGVGDGVSLLVLGESLLVDAATARPMLMAAAELVGNSVRHAFEEDDGVVTLQVHDDGTTTLLVVEDDGRCEGWWRPGGQGNGIVDALAAAMGGRVRRTRTVGGSSRVEVAVPTLAAAATEPAGAA